MICDLSEYYHILDYEAVDVQTLSILVKGLPESSRVVKSIRGVEYDYDMLLKSLIADNTTLLLWSKTKDGQKNKNRPKSLVKALLGEDKSEKASAFMSKEAFERARREIIEGGE